jgi:hypothetical protein
MNSFQKQRLIYLELLHRRDWPETREQDRYQHHIEGLTEQELIAILDEIDTKTDDLHKKLPKIVTKDA